MKKLWGGRFEKNTDALMEDFNSSISFDKKLYKYDIEGSIAHAIMLGETGIIKEEESHQIIEGLKSIRKDIELDRFDFDKKHEDIHMNIEAGVIDKIGEVAKKLHTARSRNDQVALDLKMYSRDSVKMIQTLLKEWIEALVDVSEKNIDTIMPGYTHLQRAQPITFAHNLMAHAEMAVRDYKRLESWLNIHNTMPLGSGALAGTTFPIDRYRTCELLGFESPCLNSLDGVSDRDYVVDLLSACSVGMMHLSRICEELVIWSTQEFSFIEIDDAYSTGSSMMPQKKNPDAAELIRGKTGRVYGDLMAILTTLKGLPLAYNKDMQEDKECLFDGVETWIKSLSIIIPMIKTMKIKFKNTFEATKGGFTNATDLADYLVKKGVAFRNAHKITGEIVLDCIYKGISLNDISLEEYKIYSEKIDDDIYKYISLEECVNKRNSIGGPSKEQVSNHIDILKKYVNTLSTISDI
ncbi:argininosuccinate lyase [Peptostreptococcus canis]|uniref:Argininosuccinate lyase n=1 Tax=Peptostreptococcus canis TaxID=1159213 RepID=A0ABR6TLG2_9FIRM|nr:argininosuccinate lyase [Peptostreptococcus canis]MBC2576244.1 argininosuccinate lyase [Peptostreptococcus canis]MBP1998221.1 argininosuccinate lyase [Peptostreptococcus canis]